MAESQIRRPWVATVQSVTAGSEGAAPRAEYKVSDQTWKEQEQPR